MVPAGAFTEQLSVVVVTHPVAQGGEALPHDGARKRQDCRLASPGAALAGAIVEPLGGVVVPWLVSPGS